MVRVEIMAHEDCKTLQDGINKFIKDKEVIDIKYQATALPTEVTNGIATSYSFFDRVLIIYKEDISE